ncbi:chaperone modulator CbpM [Azospirillum sp.]|uniref:chaperone modulator CbpM n=1 Tax=Azospirillum sp. TaxID=34012 RepID=UPI003D74AEE3
MSMDIAQVLASCRRVNAGDLTLWIERRWIRPHHEGAGWSFTEVDVARIELICDLRHDMDLNDEAVPVVLSLLDTVHGLRRRLSLLAVAIARLPPDARAALAAELERGEDGEDTDA